MLEVRKGVKYRQQRPVNGYKKICVLAKMASLYSLIKDFERVKL